MRPAYALPAEGLAGQPVRSDIVIDLGRENIQVLPVATQRFLMQQHSLCEWELWVGLERLAECACRFGMLLFDV